MAVVGGGPAGLSAALLLRRAGCQISCYERFETPQPVGSGLMIQPTGLAVLAQLGLAERLRRNASEIERLFGKTTDADRTVLDVRYAAIGHACGFGVHRATLFDILHEAALAGGIAITHGKTVAASEIRPEGRFLQFEDGQEAGPFDLVVDALGHASPLAPRIGRNLPYGALWASLDWPGDGELNGRALEQRYEAASVMVGVLPIGRDANGRQQAAFFWSLRVDQLEAWRTAGLDAWKADALQLWPATAPLLEQIRSPDQLTFARYAHRTVSRPFASRLVHIGDAWHSTSPQLGQGANMALLDAYALRIALGRERELEAALRRYHRLRRRHVHAYQLMSWLFTPVYQSDSQLLPLLRDRLVGPLSKRWPATVVQALMVSGLVGDPLKSLGLSE
ncbi:NAD(P)/FAD-dependent oxidoreductase [Phenylobacterium sp. LjRoot225]|uniref:FAD-dependent oxidoreductase n=1 Tax=Phenylobacterium sp. LjRoot225 TaxID=3342285 RepID=UPI003ECD2EFD